MWCGVRGWELVSQKVLNFFGTLISLRDGLLYKTEFTPVCFNKLIQEIIPGDTILSIEIAFPGMFHVTEHQ